MKKLLFLTMVAAAGLAGAAAAEFAGLESLLATNRLPGDVATVSARVAYEMLVDADFAADEAWLKLKSREEYDGYRRELQQRMIAAVGGFPERTALNAVSKRAYATADYQVENVYFESMPGVFVTGNFYLPANPKFASPYPAVVVTCGHSVNGKGAKGYQHACVQLAKAGIAAFIYDPYEQGERLQPPGNLHNCGGHNEIGVRAAMLGGSMAQLRLWDGIRSIDYVVSRPEVDAARIGYMGQSGGGTMTSLMMAVDERIQVAAPSCYLTNFRSLCSHWSPQDAEQNIYGQLAFGLNHLGYLVMRDIPVALTGKYHDFFPYQGSVETLAYAKKLEAMLGESGRYVMAFSQGNHGWIESTINSSVAWMRHWLITPDQSFKLEMADYRRQDIGFSFHESDNGIPEPVSWCAPQGQVANLPGFKSIYTVLAEKLAACERQRPKRRTAAELAELAIGMAAIPMPVEKRTTACLAGRAAGAGFTVEYYGFMDPSGYVFPGVLLQPAVDSLTYVRPVLMAGAKGRAEFAAAARKYLAKGRPVMVVDVFGYGEIGAKDADFYSAQNYPEESAAVTLYLLGKTAVGWRAGDLLAAADYLTERFKTAPELVASGAVAIPAAHARAARRDLIAELRLEQPVRAWAETLRDPTEQCPFANVVPGALVEYDWTDLLGE